MTIGVVNELRGRKIADRMLDYLKEECQYNIKVKYIYLHMVTYNKIG